MNRFTGVLVLGVGDALVSVQLRFSRSLSPVVGQRSTLMTFLLGFDRPPSSASTSDDFAGLAPARPSKELLLSYSPSLFAPGYFA